jgi:predicted adenine nucleotide alpha hydrolase (AANH) superfamily ATPase
MDYKSIGLTTFETNKNRKVNGELRLYEFSKRKSFMAEDYNTCFFDAVSLAVVHCI